MDAHVELVRAHHEPEAELAGHGAVLAAAGVIAGDLQEHLDAAAVEKLLVAGHVGVMPNAVCDRRADVDLQVAVLPHADDLGAVDRRHRIARAAAIELLRRAGAPRQRGVPVSEQVPRGLRIVEHVEGQAVGFRVPPGGAPVGLARQPLRADVQAGVDAVIGLVQLEDAIADALFVFGVAFDADVDRPPDMLPIGRMRRQGGVERRGEGFPGARDAVVPDGFVGDGRVALAVVDDQLVERPRAAFAEVEREFLADELFALDGPRVQRPFASEAKRRRKRGGRCVLSPRGSRTSRPSAPAAASARDWRWPNIEGRRSPSPDATSTGPEKFNGSKTIRWAASRGAAMLRKRRKRSLSLFSPTRQTNSRVSVPARRSNRRVKPLILLRARSSVSPSSVMRVCKPVHGVDEKRQPRGHAFEREGVVDVVFLEDAVQVASEHSAAAVALLEIAAHAHVFVAQGEDGLGHFLSIGMEALFDDRPRIDFEISRCNLRHGSPLSFSSSVLGLAADPARRRQTRDGAFVERFSGPAQAGRRLLHGSELSYPRRTARTRDPSDRIPRPGARDSREGGGQNVARGM